MLDGIDGSGKSTVIDAWKKYLTDEGNGIFDLRHYWQINGRHPALHEVKSYDFVFSCEPTYTGVGKVIREELIKKGTHYPVSAIAEAYALDRLILYTNTIIPLLTDGRCVIQDRGISSSLAYQSVGADGLTMEKIAALSGNALALQNRPDHLIILRATPEKCLSRLTERTEKQDNVIFEKLEFMKKLDRVFSGEEFQNMFANRGTRLHYLNADAELDTMKADAIRLLKQIL